MAFDYKEWKEQQFSTANDPSKSTDSGECPTVIFLVGTVWSAVGFLLLLGAVLAFWKSRKISDIVGLLFFGSMHLGSGLRTLTGTAPGTVRNGIVAAVFGFVWVMIAVVGAGPAMTSPTAHEYAPLLVLGIGITGVALVTTAVLAMIYSETYQRWIDPHGSAARASAPVQRQRVDRPTSSGKETASKSSIPGWVWLCAVVGMLVFGFLGGAVLFVKPRAPSGNSKPSATMEDYGRYGSKGRDHTETNRNASGGVNVLSDEDVTLLEQTDQIPCQVGERWGFRISSSDVPANRPYTVRQEMYHPPIPQPDGSILTKSVREVKVPPGRAPHRYYGWLFLEGYEYELVPGEWTVAVFIDDVEVARKSFHIRK